jgi:hypothetical protein
MTKPRMCNEATRAFAKKMRARDWNRMLSAGLFSERGFEDLQRMIERHGRATLDDAVRGFLACSKTDRQIARGYVRSWRYFTKHCEQIAMEKAQCAE